MDSINFNTENGPKSSRESSTYHCNYLKEKDNLFARSIAKIVTTPNSQNLSSCNNTVLTGVIVNGFHPQLYTWKQNNKCCNNTIVSIAEERNENCEEDNTPLTDKNKKRNLSNLSSLEENIQKKVSRARNDTLKEVNRMKNESSLSRTTMIARRNASTLNIYSDMFENSKVPQLIAAPGGRIAAWNQQFLNIFNVVNRDEHMKSLTLFDIVIPSMIPKLYEIFLIALKPGDVHYTKQDGSDNDGCGDEVNHNDVKYSSLIVPCVNLGQNDEQYYITLSLMYDEDPHKRCFHCILSTTHKQQPLGEIFSICQNILMKML